MNILMHQIQSLSLCLGVEAAGVGPVDADGGGAPDAGG